MLQFNDYPIKLLQIREVVFLQQIYIFMVYIPWILLGLAADTVDAFSCNLATIKLIGNVDRAADVL